MKANITIVADTGEVAQDTIEINKKGDVELGVQSTMSLFRVLHPDVPPFGKTIRIEHA